MFYLMQEINNNYDRIVEVVQGEFGKKYFTGNTTQNLSDKNTRYPGVMWQLSVHEIYDRFQVDEVSTPKIDPSDCPELFV